MRRLIFLAVLMVVPPAFAQLVAPLTTSDGHIACIQGETGIGRLPAWKAIPDPEALGGWALVETAGDTTELHFPLCISTQTVALDVDATLRFKPISGTAARSAGIVLRAQSATDYYVVAANALDGSVRLYRMQGGRRAQIAAKQTNISTGGWHKLQVVLTGDKFQVSLDDTRLFTANDRSLPQPGTVGVWSQSDSVTHFGSLLVAPPS
jgi:Laminin G domain